MNQSDIMSLVKEFASKFSEQDLDDHVISLKEQEASDINNGGPESQLEFIISGFTSIDEARAYVESMSLTKKITND